MAVCDDASDCKNNVVSVKNSAEAATSMDTIVDNRGTTTAPAQSSNKECDFCTSIGPNKLRCGRCKTAWYCNRDCQAKAWKVGVHIISLVPCSCGPGA